MKEIMKNTLNIFVIAIAAFIMQGCETKSNESNEQEEEAAKVEASSALSQSEKRAETDKRRLELLEKRKIAYQELVSATPFYTNDEGVTVYNKAEVDPTYVGGKDAMQKYLADNLVYPADAEEDGLEGTVYVNFLIANDGSVRNVIASNSTWENVDEQFNAEAIRVVSNMPNWVAGTQHGKAVYVAYSVPITFRLN
jgi:periplasmic protein TonB